MDYGDDVAALLVKEGPLAGRRLPVETELVIGRVNADVTIDDPQISRRHALVRPVGGALEIEDLGSLNGTWVNGERITSARRLLPGDVLRLGETTAEVEVEEREQSPDRGGTRPRLRLEPAGRRPPRRAANGRPPGRETSSGRSQPSSPTSSARPRSASDSRRTRSRRSIGDSVTRMSREVERFGGSVQAYMGDGIAVYFGVPAVHEDDPERAAWAGLAILDTIREYAQEVEATWGISNFSARVGINTGPGSGGPGRRRGAAGCLRRGHDERRSTTGKPRRARDDRRRARRPRRR